MDSFVHEKILADAFIGEINSRNGQVGGYQIDNDFYLDDKSFIQVKSIVVNNCKFIGSVTFSNFDKIVQINFNNCIFEEKCNFIDVNRPVRFNSCNFNRDFSFSSRSQHDFNITNITAKGDFTLEGSFTGTLSLTNFNITDEEPIKQGQLIIKCEKGTKIKSVNVGFDQIVIHDSMKPDDPSKSETVFESTSCNKLSITAMSGARFDLNKVNIESIAIDSSSSDGNIDLRIDNESKIGQAELPLNFFKRVDISSTEFNLLSFSGKNSSDINVNNVQTNNLKFKDVINEGSIALRNVKIPRKGILTIITSDLRKADFIRCEFGEAILEFENSKVTEIFVALGTLPQRVQLNGKPNHDQAQLAFAQLHTAFLRQGDTIRSFEYRSREVEAYYEVLKTPPFWQRRVDFVTLRLNKYSNNFGRSWTRGVIFSLFSGVIFYYALILSTQEYRFGFPISIDWRLITSFLKFMNPVRFYEIDQLFKINSDERPYLSISNYSYLWDFLGRVFVAYGFYQTIQAFRKFGRK